MTWIRRLASWFWPDENELDDLNREPLASVSFVRPVAGKKPRPEVSTEYIEKWKQNQRKAGRFVIADTHFHVGGHLRSVPRLSDIPRDAPLDGVVPQVALTVNQTS